MTKELSLTRYKGHEQATAIAKTKAVYRWMNAPEAKVALVKAVSGSLRACTQCSLAWVVLASTALIHGYTALVFAIAVACS
jgi:hypothetical protein